MKMRSTLLAFALLFAVFAAHAQSSGNLFTKPPAGVEEALRARVSEFLNLHMEGKFRQSERLVCEDTKDHFYMMDKQRYKGVEQQHITWGEDYKSAKVQVVLDVTLGTPVGPLPAKFPTLLHWRVEEGNWCYFVPKYDRENIQTPFGTMKVPAEGTAVPAGPPPGAPPSFNPEQLKEMRNAIRMTSSELRFEGKPQTLEFEFNNTMVGPVRLRIPQPPHPSLGFEIDDLEVPPNGKRTLRVRFQPKGEISGEPLNFVVQVAPFGQTIPLKIFLR
jgi:hypothetical protein